jgi:hypothetical protein
MTLNADPCYGSGMRWCCNNFLWILALTALLAAIVVSSLPPPPTSRITKENFDRIQLGMTQDEVEEILGPEGWYNTKGCRNICIGCVRLRGQLEWVGDEGVISIQMKPPDDGKPEEQPPRPWRVGVKSFRPSERARD